MITFDSKLAPKLGPYLSHKNQTEGSYFQLLCTVQEGSLPLFFEWSKNGHSIKTNPDVNYKIDNFERSSTLTIPKINRKDTGNYTCIVRNTFGTDSQTVLLTVKGMLSLMNFSLNTKMRFQFLQFG
jgi:hypothetical protein